MKNADTGPSEEQMPHLATKDFKTQRFMTRRNFCRIACDLQLLVPNGLIRIKICCSGVLLVVLYERSIDSETWFPTAELLERASGTPAESYSTRFYVCCSSLILGITKIPIPSVLEEKLLIVLNANFFTIEKVRVL
jgi:hypothetical protein